MSERPAITGVVTSRVRLDMAVAAFRRQGARCVLAEPGPQPSPPEAVADAYYCVPTHDAVQYATSMLDVCRREKAEFVISTASYDDLAEADARLEPYLRRAGISFFGHDTRCTTTCRDKWTTKTLLARSGIPTTAGRLCTSERELERCRKEIGGPVVVKSLNWWSGRGQAILVSPDQPHPVPPSFPVLVEPFVMGVEMSLEVFRFGGRELILPPVYKGPTTLENIHALEKVRVCPYPGWGAALLEESAAIAKQVSVALDARGWLDIDAIASQDGLAVLEVNARFSGVCRLLALATGVNPYELAVCATLGRPVPSSIKANEIAVEVPLHAEPDLDGLPGVCLTIRKPGRTHGYMTFSGPDRDSVMDTARLLLPRAESSRYLSDLEHAMGGVA